MAGGGSASMMKTMTAANEKLRFFNAASLGASPLVPGPAFLGF
jgi:hypothetical protein